MISIRNKYGFKYLSYDPAKKDWIVDIRLSDRRVKRSFRQKKDAIIFSNKISGYVPRCKPKLALSVRAKIVELIHSGKTAAEVGIIVGCSPSTASKWYARFTGERSENGYRFILTMESKV
ncbi:helix-turn-helix domain-containing protein [Sphingobacterium detergens]|uniref:helix-turn-helix domain-containing protein n=1 Tax=Sphingobacterium detergens TaxID=1145106 RepID=UPI003AAFD50D